MIEKHLIDSDLYIELIRTGKTLGIIQAIYERYPARVYLSSVVAQELLSGAHTPNGRQNIRTLLSPFEKARRIATPRHRHWKETGLVLARLLRKRPDLKSKLPVLVNDCLLALTARSLGATLYTMNGRDFQLIRKLRPFSLVVISPL